MDDVFRSEPEVVDANELLHQLDRALQAQMTWLKTWHAAVLRSRGSVSSESTTSPESLPAAPTGLARWIDENAGRVLVDQPAVQRLGRAERAIAAHAEALAIALLHNDPTIGDRLAAMMDGFAAFFAEARRVERTFITAAAQLDPLTGAHNRYSMMVSLERERARVLRLGRTSSLVLADIDHFKRINDRFGHGVGDRVLAAVADLFLSGVRRYDTVYRYGGEEFLICFSEIPSGQVAPILDRLAATLRSTPIAFVDEQPLNVTCSFGVAEFEANVSCEQTIDRADQALYEAKRQGRDRLCVWRADAASPVDLPPQLPSAIP